MDTGHTGAHCIPETGHVVEPFAAPDVPRFRHKAPRYMLPRYWTALAGLMFGCSIGFGYDAAQAVHGWDIDRWNAGHTKLAFMWLTGLWLTVLLWKSWHREEQYPELLPDDEYDRRFPTHAGSPPSSSIRYTEDVTPTGGTTHQIRADGSCGTPSHEHR